MGILGDIFDITPTGMLVNALGDTFGPATLSATDQAANIEAIHKYIAGTMPNNDDARKLQDEWTNWYGPLNWYQKNADKNIALEAFNKRNAFMRANTYSAKELADVNAFLKKTPIIDPVTGNPTLVTSTGDRAVPPPPLIPPVYKYIAVGSAAVTAVLVVLKKLRIL